MSQVGALVPSMTSGPVTKGSVLETKIRTVPNASTFSAFAKRIAPSPARAFASSTAARKEHSWTPNMPTLTQAPVLQSPLPGLRSDASSLSTWKSSAPAWATQSRLAGDVTLPRRRAAIRLQRMRSETLRLGIMVFSLWLHASREPRPGVRGQGEGPIGSRARSVKRFKERPNSRECTNTDAVGKLALATQVLARPTQRFVARLNRSMLLQGSRPITLGIARAAPSSHGPSVGRIDSSDTRERFDPWELGHSDASRGARWDARPRKRELRKRRWGRKPRSDDGTS